MMKTFGRYLERGANDTEYFVTVPALDRERYTNMFAENVLRNCVEALAETSIGI